MCRPKGENKLITVTVDKYTLSPKRIIAGTRGSFGTETLVFDLGEDWDDMTDVALTFRAPNGEAVSVRYDGEPVAIPQEIMSHSGISEYIISGYKGTNTLLSLTGEISVLNTLDPDAAYAAEPTLTLVGELLERTKNAEGVAESVRSDADNGVFDGRGIAHITVSADRNISVEYTDGTVEDGGHFEANQRGEAAPTEETFGENGSIYTDVNGTIYYCMGCDDEGKYLWKIIYSLPVENFGDAQPMQETHFFYIPINQRSILNFGDTTPFRKEIHIPSASEAVKGDMFDFEFSTGGGLFDIRIENGDNCYPYPCTLHQSFKYRFHGDFDGKLWTVKVDEFPLYECTTAEKVCVALGYVPADKEALEARDPANKILERLTINEVAYYDSIVTCIDDLNNGQPAVNSNDKSDRSECYIYLKNGTLVIVLLKDIFPLERLYIKVPVEFVFAGHKIIVASSNVTAGLTCNGSYTYINGTMGGGVYVENPKTSSWCICAGPSVTKFIVDGGEYTIKGKDQNTGSAKAIETYNSDCITQIRNARIDISGVGNIVVGCNFVDKATVKDSNIKIYTTSSTSVRGILAQNDIHIENCDINTVATVGISSGVSVEKGRATVVACNIEADSSNNVMDDTSTYGCALKVSPEAESCSISYGTYTGTHSAVGMMSNDFHALGATFYSCAHGGIYFSGKKAYVKDCVIGCRAYNGRFDFSSMENDLLGDFYIGSNSDCTVYMDNCVLTGEGNHCGVLRGSGGEKRNILYISRTAIPDGKQFRIDSGNYMVAGEGSDVDETQVTLPSALSTTAYIYDYEHMCANEVSESMTAYVDNKLIATFPLSDVDYAENVVAQANRMTNISTLTGNINISLGDAVSGYDNEWDFAVTQGDNAYDVALPTVNWGFGVAPSFSANTTTVCRLYYIGNTLCGEWVAI